MSTHKINYPQWERIVKHVLKINVGDADYYVPWYLLFDDCGLSVTVDDVIQFAAKYDKHLSNFLVITLYSCNTTKVFRPNCTLV